MAEGSKSTLDRAVENEVRKETRLEDVIMFQTIITELLKKWLRYLVFIASRIENEQGTLFVCVIRADERVDSLRESS